jgi:hypothetical protein
LEKNFQPRDVKLDILHLAFCGNMVLACSQHLQATMEK